ncbi:hypothetical protein ACFLSQ_09680 [Bacteroidota bacterium]
MSKLIAIFLILGLVLGYVYYRITKRFRNFFSSINNPQDKSQQNSKEEVIYDKDDVVVLRGESKKEDGKTGG